MRTGPSVGRISRSIDVPVFTVLGYFDDFSSGTARIIDALDAEAVCGPWTHMPWGSRHGGTEVGVEASPAIVFERLVAFFDRVFDRAAAAVNDRAGDVPQCRIGLADGEHVATARPARALDGDERWERQLAPRRRVPRAGRRRAGPPDVLVVEPLRAVPG